MDKDFYTYQPLTAHQYDDWTHQAQIDPNAFWAEQARWLDWHQPWHTVGFWDYQTADIRWFEGAKLNACYNCLDRHLPHQPDKPAILWQGDDPSQTQMWTYQTLHDRVCQIANALKALGVKKGDRVCLYLPMIPESWMCVLACARIGAIHSVVFAGFSAQSLRERILDTGARLVITADEGRRGGKTIPLKETVDAALEGTISITQVLVIAYTKTPVPKNLLRDVDFYDLVNRQSSYCPPVWMESEDPLFILYTSGSTGRPKGVCHSTAGYLLYALLTFRYAFDYRPDDIYWCTADIGWITGHSYGVYAPLANGATSVMFEGTPAYPTPARFWQIIEKFRVSIFYTAPTVIRALMAEGNDYPRSCDLSSLRILGTVGEPINPEAWHWYRSEIGRDKCSIIDTWWQTETGGILVAPWPNAVEPRPGVAGLPFFGIIPHIVTDAEKPQGALVIQKAWPGQMRTVYGNHSRFKDTYFSAHPGAYTTGDLASYTEEGHIQMGGRMDDVVNVSGHRLGTAEIESALAKHPDVSEAAIVGIPHPIKGECLIAFVVSKSQAVIDDKIALLQKWVAEQIGKHAKPDVVYIVPALPKTRSGKVMRRILRHIALGQFDNLGDVSTLADPAVIAELKKVAEPF